MRCHETPRPILVGGGGPAWSAVLGLLVLSTALSAQTLPLPTLPTEPATAEPASPDPTAPSGGLDSLGAATQSRPPDWEYGVGAGVGWDSNIDFLLPDGPRSWAVVPRGRLDRVLRSPRGELRLGGLGSWTGYPEASDLSRYSLGFLLDGSYRSSEDTVWRANGSYSFGYSDSSVILSDQGVLLPPVKTQTLAGELGVTRRLGSRTSFRLHGRIYRVGFNPEDIDPLRVVDGNSIRGSTALERTLGSRDTVAVEYALEGTLRQRTDTAANVAGRYLTHYASLLWTRALSPRSGLLVQGGGSFTPEAEQAGLAERATFYGGASYSRQVKRSSVVVFARREVAPAFGLGVSRIDNRFGLDVATPLGRDWRLAVSGTFTRPETPSNATLTYGTSVEFYGTLARRVGRMFEISAETRYRRRGVASGFPEVERFQAGLFLSLLSPKGTSSATGVGRQSGRLANDHRCPEPHS